jgi:hypothetical protein
MSKKKVVLSARERERRARQRAAQRQQALAETASSGLRRIVRWPQLDESGSNRQPFRRDSQRALAGKAARKWEVEILLRAVSARHDSPIETRHDRSL